jgi:hypothetical protein
MSDIQEEQKRLYKRAEENDIKLLKEKIDSLESQLDFIEEQNKYIEKLENRINKVIEEINKRSTKEVAELYIDILKGDNK